MRSHRFSALCFGLVLVGILFAVPGRADIEGASWFPIGPAPGGFSAFPGGISGRATAVAVNPANNDDIWLGTSQGGLWRSTDGGTSWTPMSDQEASLAIGSLALADCAAQGCTSIYAGTGENAIRRDTFYGQGLLVGSVDGLEAFWDLKTGTPYNFRRGSINDVVLDPTTMGSSRVIYVTLSSGITASATESTVTAPEPNPGGYGIYKSMDDGSSWNEVIVEGAEGDKPTDLKMDPMDNLTLYAGYLGRGVFKSTNGGADWCPLNKGVPKPMGCPNVNGLPNVNNTTVDHVEIAIFPNDSQILYASFGHCPNKLVDSCTPSLYKSTDGGMSWNQTFVGSEAKSSSCPGGYSRYTHALAVDPDDSATVFLGGIRLCKSTDSGMGWALSDDNTFGDISTHFDHRQIVFNENDSNLVYNTNDGGIAISTDGGNLWTPKNGNLQTVGFQGIATSPLTARVIGGAQDNSGQMWLGANTWDHLPCCGDGGFSVMDLDNAMRMYVTTNTSPNVYAVPTRSSDGGSSFGDVINTGLNSTEPRSFYPPLVQDPSGSHPLYFGTQRLFRSTNDAGSWSAVSPVLSTTPMTDEIFAGQDAITAIAVSPSNPDRIYLGYYSGKVFVTDGPCANLACWPQRDSGLPSAPISWIAVHPTNPDTAYATLSGFFSGIHVYKTTNGGVTWTAAAGHADLNGVPANTIVVEPSAPSRLWLGTDIGVYKSHTSGGSWFRLSGGLPNVPVFEISIDESHGRVLAGTHGRGAYILTKPFLSNFEGWVGDNIWDIPVYGHGFLANQTCTLKILRQDLSVCASGTKDAIDGDIKTDAGGMLFTTKGGFWNGKNVAWACLNGNCLGNTPIANCNQPGNKIAAVIALCGPQVGIDVMTGCPPITDPPSSWFNLTGLGGFRAPVASIESGRGVTMFELSPTLQVGDGTTRKLCTVEVPFSDMNAPKEVLETANDAVNNDATCVAEGVSSEILAGRFEHEDEDLFPDADNLRLMGPTLTGGQLIPAMRAAPGQTTGICFKLNRLGVPVGNQVRIMRVRFEGNALGGEVTLRERSPLGDCAISVPTALGDTPGNVAQALEDAFQAPGIPGPNPTCSSEINPRDVSRHGDSVVTVLASEVELCVDDPGLGFSIAPEETCFNSSDCDDGNPCTADQCNTEIGQCVSSPVPDDTQCEDNNACTTGGTCQNGVCGVPIDCSDGDACTDDTCDPATGRCLNPPVECDDGNVCTTDSCDAGSGQCLFEPQVGAQCDDGDMCTRGACVVDQVTQVVTCESTPICEDGDPCTAEVCDPADGICSNQQIDCDDGNPCTFNFCSGGICGIEPLTGAQCDDGDLCTTDELCVDIGLDVPVCEGQPLDCSDGDVCTEDICNPAFGTCENPAEPLERVGGLLFDSKTKMTWGPTVNATHWNTYRGTIPRAGLGNRSPVYDHSCFESADSAGDGALVSTDNAIPAPGTGFYYDNTEEGRCGEGPLGVDSNGTTRPMLLACPTPP